MFRQLSFARDQAEIVRAGHPHHATGLRTFFMRFFFVFHNISWSANAIFRRNTNKKREKYRSQLRNNVHCIALLGDRKAGLYFGALDAREMNVLASVIHDNRREVRVLRLFKKTLEILLIKLQLLFSLSCDNATRRDCALFESAYIHHSCAEGQIFSTGLLKWFRYGSSLRFGIILSTVIFSE